MNPLLEDDDTFERQLKLLARQNKALKARRHLMDFVEFTSPDPSDPDDAEKSTYHAQRFHRIIAKHFEDMIEGRLLDSGKKVTKIIFVMPPRHGKSEIATRKLTPWVAGRYPSWDMAVATFNDKLAEDFGGDVRSTMYSKNFQSVFPSYKLRKGDGAKANIRSLTGGRIVFVGRGGTLTGRGARLGICDDLFKDDEEARSPTIRDQAWNWFNRVFMSRLMNPKLVILVMTRWHSDDVIGRLTDPKNDHYSKEEADTWKIIHLKAVAEDDDPLGRKPGEPLWEEAADLEFLRGMERRDKLGYASLYQGKPTVEDGTLFLRENVRWYTPDQIPETLRYYASSDHAVGLEQRNDPSCFIKVGVDAFQDIYLLECDWRRIDGLQQVEAMLTMGTNGRDPVFWWAEKEKITKAIGPFLRKAMQESQRYVNIVEVTPSKDKQQRAQPIAARFAQQKVYFPKSQSGAPLSWANRAVEELMEFPNGTHDDFVDALSWIGIGLTSIFGKRKKDEGDKKPKFGTLDWVKQNDDWTKRRMGDRKYGRLS